MACYTVEALDHDGYWLRRDTDIEKRKNAIKLARDWIEDNELITDDLRKVEVSNALGVVIFDIYLTDY